MSPASVPIVLFGDLDADLWGVIVGGADPGVSVAGLTDADLVFTAADLDLRDDDVWTLNANGAALRVEPAAPAEEPAEASTTASTAAPKGSGHELTPCRVSGAATAPGLEREFDVAGVRLQNLDLGDAASLRLFASWFPGSHEVAVLASRPKGAKGHDQDELSVIAIGEEHPMVLDPRLSSTYDIHGDPLRVGVELWLADDPDAEEQFSLRVAGLATGSRVTESQPGAKLGAHALECVSRGERGAGIYLLAQAG
jgi:hypothetical protein